MLMGFKRYRFTIHSETTDTDTRNRRTGTSRNRIEALYTAGNDWVPYACCSCQSDGERRFASWDHSSHRRSFNSHWGVMWTDIFLAPTFPSVGLHNTKYRWITQLRCCPIQELWGLPYVFSVSCSDTWYHRTVFAATSQNTISFTYIFPASGIANLHDESRNNK